MTYTAKRTFGGYGVFDADGNQVGENYTGTGAKAQAEEAAATLNGDGLSVVADDTEPDPYVRGDFREGRSA